MAAHRSAVETESSSKFFRACIAMERAKFMVPDMQLQYVASCCSILGRSAVISSGYHKGRHRKACAGSVGG
jgi:hypothetical protein